jgi:trans-aconitate methyltransferase
VGDQFHFNPETYLELIHREVPAYEQLQDSVADATSDFSAPAVLDLGVGIGVTSQRILAQHPGAQIVGIDESPAMLDYAHRALPAADLRVARFKTHSRAVRSIS